MNALFPLNDTMLDRIAVGVARPAYDRSTLGVGIVHVGVGGFHRAHMAMALDTLMNAGIARDWAICGVGLLESDRRMKAVFDAQDCLYTLTLKHPDGRRESRVIGSITEYLFAPDDAEAVVERMADPEVRIVSLTITEGGYNFDRVTGSFDATNAGVVADLVDGAVPSTVFGFVTEALRRRRDRGIPPFTVLSCDNVQGNGHMASKMFTAFADLKDPELGEWIRSQVKFPNSMVDRITPVTVGSDIDEAKSITGLDDGWPVVCEPFFQWVIEDDFGLGRPPFDRAGAQFVTDVEPYELMKLRLLNASHQAMCYFGYLAGYRYAHEAVGDPVIAGFLRRYMDREASPTLRPVPGIDLDEYKAMLIERFSNPEVRDTLARLCAESSDRIPKWLVPVIRQQLASGGEIDCSAAVVASWARYDEAVDDNGEAIVVVDALRDELVAIALTQRDDPLAFIRNRSLFGDLADDERFGAAYLAALSSLHSQGALKTVESLMSRTPEEAPTDTESPHT
ncbi:MAG: mannitol dehydrogenase family protein [Actinomycetota bacterium]